MGVSLDDLGSSPENEDLQDQVVEATAPTPAPVDQPVPPVQPNPEPAARATETNQYKKEIELGLDLGIGDGKSGAALARELEQYLREPDRLFRRVRDKHGQLVLSKAAQAYHPGQGVYRSSVKNAQRLTRTENNNAYHESNFLKYQHLWHIIIFPPCSLQHAINHQ